MKTTILTDIEGTTSSISFVKDVLFPYARRELPRFVRERGHEPEVRQWLDMVAAEHGGMCQDEMIVETLQGMIDQDRKHTALKALQGMIWLDGYRGADFTAQFRFALVLDAQLHQPDAKRHHALQPSGAVEDRVERIEGHYKNAFPRRGVDGAAMSRASMASASKASRPASTASAKPRAMATVSPALATAVLMSTAS